MAEQERILIGATTAHVGETVRISGWVVSRRGHGKITFIDVRDRSGVLQTVGVKLEQSVSMYDVVDVTGLVKDRPAHMVNANLETGTVELEISSLQVVNKAQELPFDMGGLNLDVS